MQTCALKIKYLLLKLICYNCVCQSIAFFFNVGYYVQRRGTQS